MSSERQEKRRIATHRALLAAALKAFRERGIHATSIDDITMAADLGKGTFYNHFESREDLIAQVLHLGLEPLADELARGTAGVMSWQDLLARVLEIQGRYWAAHPEHLLVLHQARGWSKLFRSESNPIRAEIQHHTTRIAQLLGESAPGRLLAPPELERIARVMVGAATGVLSFVQELSSDPPRMNDLMRLLSELHDPKPWDLPPPPPALFRTGEPAVSWVQPGGSDDGVGADGDWSAAGFAAQAGEWLSLLRRPESNDSVRWALMERVNRLHYATYSGLDGMHELDLILVRDCARAWRGLLHPRSDQIAGTSFFGLLREAARSPAEPSCSRAFWADVIHLVRGVEGKVRFHGSIHGASPPALEGREAALRRSAELEQLGLTVERWMSRYEDGLGSEALQRRAAARQRILAALGGTDSDWQNWRWHCRHVAVTAPALARMVRLSDEEYSCIQQGREAHVPFGVTPYYASLFDPEPDGGRDRSLRAQVIPPADYLAAVAKGCDPTELDFMREADTSPIDLVTRRYAGIAILKPHNTCPQICVYCQRNWEIKGPLEPGATAKADKLEAALAWIEQNRCIREVLVTGGDPLLLSNEALHRILDRLCRIPHIERIRIGTRMLVTLPMRFTSSLCSMLGACRSPGRREIVVVTHVQHPYEVTQELVTAANCLRQHGISIYNQLVFTFFASRRFEAASLRRLLRRCGIDPYYTFNTKGKGETASYRVPIARLLQEQKEEARLLPGLERTDSAVYNVPGLGKNNLDAWQHRDFVSLRPDGTRVYEFHPWEKQISPQKTYAGDDVPLLDYLERLAKIGEDPLDYESIWYYF